MAFQFHSIARCQESLHTMLLRAQTCLLEMEQVMEMEAVKQGEKEEEEARNFHLQA